MADGEPTADNFELRIADCKLSDLRRRLFTFEFAFSAFAFLLFIFPEVLENLQSLIVSVGDIDLVMVVDENASG